MNVMVELQDGTVYPIEDVEILGHTPLVVAFIDKVKRSTLILRVRRFFTQKDPQ